MFAEDKDHKQEDDSIQSKPMGSTWTLESLVSDVITEEYTKKNKLEFIDSSLKLLQNNQIKTLKEWAELSQEDKNIFPKGLKVMLDSICKQTILSPKAYAEKFQTNLGLPSVHGSFYPLAISNLSLFLDWNGQFAPFVNRKAAILDTLRAFYFFAIGDFSKPTWVLTSTSFGMGKTTFLYRGLIKAVESTLYLICNYTVIWFNIYLFDIDASICYEFIFSEAVHDIEFEEIQKKLISSKESEDTLKRAQFINMIHWSLKTRHFIAYDVKLCENLPIESGMFFMFFFFQTNDWLIQLCVTVWEKAIEENFKDTFLNTIVNIPSEGKFIMDQETIDTRLRKFKTIQEKLQFFSSIIQANAPNVKPIFNIKGKYSTSPYLLILIDEFQIVNRNMPLLKGSPLYSFCNVISSPIAGIKQGLILVCYYS